MPEGPEIRRAADKIAKVLEGKADRAASNSRFPHLKPFEAELQSREVTASSKRVAKRS